MIEQAVFFIKIGFNGLKMQVELQVFLAASVARVFHNQTWIFMSITNFNECFI
jgi:hypothetical protein